MLLMVAAALLQPEVPPASATPTESIASTDIKSLDSGEYRADAHALAEQIMPEALYSEMVGKMTAQGIRLGLGEDADEMESESPGILGELEASVVAATVPYAVRWRKVSLARYARLFSRVLSEKETESLRQFYASPTGTKIIQEKYGHVTSPEVATRLATEDSLTESEVAKISSGAASGFFKEMNAEDRAALMQRVGDPAFAKMRLLVPVINRLEAADANEGDPAYEEAVGEAITQVYRRRGLIE